jgi:outer membrane protein assembly factor BamB
MNKNMLRKTLVIGVIVSFIGISVIPCLNAIVVKNSENLANLDNEKSASTIDWWPMWSHDLNNTGYSTSPYAPETNNVLWTFQTDYMANSHPVVFNNIVYFISMDEYLYCLDTVTGALIWKDYVPGAGSLCVTDGKVISGSTYDYVYCWDADTGEKIWRFYKGYGGSRNPAVSEGKVYISYSQLEDYFYGKISCLDVDTGTEFWNRTFFDGTIGYVAVYDGKVYFHNADGKLFCLDGETGEINWEKITGGRSGGPAIANGKVYANANGIRCLDVDTGEEFWHYQGNGTYGTPAVAYNKVYYVSRDGKVICLDADTGDEVWVYIIGSGYEQPHSSPAVADGKMYVGIWSNGKLICFNASNGDIIWGSVVSPGNPGHLTSSPAIANGRLYIGSTTTGKILCFGDSSAPPVPPIINGPTGGKVGVSYNYTFNSIDPNDDDVYYYINWGDDNVEFWDGPHASGMDFVISHTYTKLGIYTIEAKAIDIYGYESNWSKFEITIPRGIVSNHWCRGFLDIFQMFEVVIW